MFYLMGGSIFILGALANVFYVFSFFFHIHFFNIFKKYMISLKNISLIMKFKKTKKKSH